MNQNTETNSTPTDLWEIRLFVSTTTQPAPFRNFTQKNNNNEKPASCCAFKRRRGKYNLHCCAKKKNKKPSRFPATLPHVTDRSSNRCVRLSVAGAMWCSTQLETVCSRRRQNAGDVVCGQRWRRRHYRAQGRLANALASCRSNMPAANFWRQNWWWRLEKCDSFSASYKLPRTSARTSTIFQIKNVFNF